MEKEKYVGNTVRTKRFSKVLRLLSAVLLLVLALCIAFFAYLNTKYDSNSLLDSLTQFMGIDNEEGFPAKFSTNDILDVKFKGKELYVLTEKFITPVGKKGEIGTAQQIAYAKPAICANDNYAVVFDRLSDKYTVIDKKGSFTQYQDKNGTQILNANITSEGNVLLSLGSSSSASILHVTDKKGEDLLIWSCGDEYIVSFDMSGDRIYCAALGAYGTEIYTKLYVLDLGESEPVCEYTIHGTACIALKHLSSDKFSVLCDDGIYICSAQGDDVVKNKTVFSSKILFYDMDSSGNIAIVFENSENLSQNLLSVFDSDAKIAYSVSVDSNILDLALEGKEVYLLYDSGVKTVTSGGKPGQDMTYTGKCVGITTSGKNAYCYSLGGVDKAKRVK